MSEICAAAEIRSRNAADQLLFEMAKDDEIVRAGRGQYALPKSYSENAGKIAKKERFEKQAIDTTTKNDNLTDLTGLVRNPKPAPTSDPWQDYPELPPSCDRRPKPAPQTNGRAPALGPPGDSLDDFK